MLATGPKVLNSAPPMLFGIDHACFFRWVIFRGVPGINNVIIGAVCVLCPRCAKTPRLSSDVMTNVYAEWVSVVHFCRSLWVMLRFDSSGGLPLDPLPIPLDSPPPSPLRSSNGLGTG